MSTFIERYIYLGGDEQLNRVFIELAIEDNVSLERLEGEEHKGRNVYKGGDEIYHIAAKALAKTCESRTKGNQFVFTHSMLLGKRAQYLYDVFVRSLNVPGDIAECGVYLGETAREVIRFLEKVGSNKTMHLFDTFSGFPDVATNEERAYDDDSPDWLKKLPGCLAMPLDAVLKHLEGVSQYQIYQGMFSETFPKFDRPLSFIHADADLYQSTVDIIKLADRVLVPGGIILFDDFNDDRFAGVTQAVREYIDPELYAVAYNKESHQGVAIKNGG